MKRLLPIALALLSLVACRDDETVTGYGGAGTWQLVLISAKAPPASLSLRLLDEGQVQAVGPCNTLNAHQSAPYPWFRLKGATVTQRACDADLEEDTIFAMLTAATLIEVAGDTLIVTTDKGSELVFTADLP